MRPTGPVTVRPAGAGDLRAIGLVWKAAFAENVKPRTIQNLLSTEGQLTLVAEGEGVVGFLTLVQASKSDRKRIDYVATHPLDAPKGAGLALMRSAEDHARASGASEITLAVRRQNTSAIRFYERCGYTLYEIRTGGFTYRKTLETP